MLGNNQNRKDIIVSKVSLSSPWIGYARKLYMLFGEDPDINIVYGELEGPEVKLYVNNSEKADALTKALPAEKEFGNVTLKITVIPANTEDAPIDIFRKIFTGNPIMAEIVIDESPSQIGMSHVLFVNEVVQYFDDRLNDPMGLETTLYEDLAREVFEQPDGVFFNTELEGDDIIIWP